jgi:hypothetical protein
LKGPFITSARAATCEDIFRTEADRQRLATCSALRSVLLFGETTDTPSLTVVTPDSLRNKTVVRFKQRLSFPLLMIVLLTPSICCAYQEDFHYYVIYFLLRSKGFDANASHQIAGFSQYVDDNRKTEPIYQWPSTRRNFISSIPHEHTRLSETMQWRVQTCRARSDSG